MLYIYILLKMPKSREMLTSDSCGFTKPTTLPCWFWILASTQVIPTLISQDTRFFLSRFWISVSYLVRVWTLLGAFLMYLTWLYFGHDVADHHSQQLSQRHHSAVYYIELYNSTGTTWEAASIRAGVIRADFFQVLRRFAERLGKIDSPSLNSMAILNRALRTFGDAWMTTVE